MHKLDLCYFLCFGKNIFNGGCEKKGQGEFQQSKFRSKMFKSSIIYLMKFLLLAWVAGFASAVVSGPGGILTLPRFREQSRNYNPNKIINQVSQNLLTTTTSRSLDRIFLRFPSCSQLDKLIMSADAAAILKTIQAIATDTSVQCSQRITYLSQLQGRLRIAVQKKKFNCKQLEVDIESSRLQIQRLSKELDSTKTSISSLQINDLKNNKTKLIEYLQKAYQELNSVEQGEVLEAKVKGYERQISVLSRSSQKQRKMMDNDQLKNLDLENQISRLEKKLKQLEYRKSSTDQNILKANAAVSKNQNDIIVLKQEAETIETGLKQYRNKSDFSNLKVRDLQVQVQRFRADVAVGEAKKTTFLKQIDQINDKIAKQKKKLVNDDLGNIQQMIESLRKMQATAQSSVDSKYFNCFGGDESVKIEQEGNAVVYVVNSGNFKEYVRNRYGQQVNIPSIRSDVVFNKVDIFGDDWIKQVGNPFMEKEFDTLDFTIDGSFNCLNEGALQAGQAVIQRVDHNYIEAKGNDGNNMIFNLSPCSRLESTQKIPQKGQKLYWSGAQGQKGLNLFVGSCL